MQKSIKNCFQQWDFCTLESLSHGLCSKCTDLLNSYEITFYKLQVENFKLGDLDLGSVPIYVTFYEKMTKALIGTNVLRLLNTHIYGDGNTLIIEKSNKFIEYKKNHLRVDIPELLDLESNKDIILTTDEGKELSIDEFIDTEDLQNLYNFSKNINE